MDIKRIIDQYGLNDYYEMATARIFKLSQANYDSKNNVSIIPVIQDGDYIGNIQVPGNIKEEYSWQTNHSKEEKI